MKAPRLYRSGNSENDLPAMNDNREKMLQLYGHLMASEEERLLGRTGCTVDELDALLDSVIDDV